MKKFFFISTLIFLSHLSINAQPIINSSFENWTPSGNPPPFNWEEPTDWKSTNSQTEFTLAGVSKTSDSYDGLYACQLKSVNISGGWPSMVCNGNPNTSGNPFSDPRLDIITGGTPINSKPSKVVGYYKFDNSDVLDSGYAKVILKKYNTNLNKQDTIGIGDFHFGESLIYTPFEIVINDMEPLIIPDSIVIAFYSTDPINPYAPNFPTTGLIIDSLSLVYGTNSIENDQNSKNDPIVYPNPANESLFVQGPNNEEYYLELYTMNGQRLKSITGKGEVELDISDLASGIYYLKFNRLDGTHSSSIKSILKQ